MNDNIKKIYHTPTIESYNDLMAKLDELGYRWNSGHKMPNLRYWYFDEENTCVMLYRDLSADCSNLGHINAKYPNIPIIEHEVGKPLQLSPEWDEINAIGKELQELKEKLKASHEALAGWRKKMTDLIDMADQIQELQEMRNELSRRRGAVAKELKKRDKPNEKTYRFDMTGYYEYDVKAESLEEAEAKAEKEWQKTFGNDLFGEVEFVKEVE